MSERSKYSVLITTTDSDEEAEKLAKELVERKLAACVQISRIVSHYMWKGEATSSNENILLMKTHSSKADAIREYIDASHSYDTPELIELPVVSGLPGYLRWIDEVLT